MELSKIRSSHVGLKIYDEKGDEVQEIFLKNVENIEQNNTFDEDYEIYTGLSRYLKQEISFEFKGGIRVGKGSIKEELEKITTYKIPVKIIKEFTDSNYGFTQVLGEDRYYDLSTRNHFEEDDIFKKNGKKYYRITV